MYIYLYIYTYICICTYIILGMQNISVISRAVIE